MGWSLLGLLLIVYAVVVAYIAFKQPEKIWDMAKIQLFRKVLGELGPVIFFVIFALAALGFGVWLLVFK
jgi:hypothetical protein